MADGGVKKLTQITLGIDNVTSQLTSVKQQLAAAAQEINTDARYKINLSTSTDGMTAIKTQVDSVGTSLKTTTENAQQLDQTVSSISQKATDALHPLVTEANNAGNQLKIVADVTKQLGSTLQNVQATSDSTTKNLKTEAKTVTEEVKSWDGAYTTLTQTIVKVNDQLVKTNTTSRTNTVSAQKQLATAISSITELSLKASGLTQTTGVEEFSSHLAKVGEYANQLVEPMSKGLANDAHLVVIKGIVEAVKQFKVQLTLLQKEQNKANATQNKAETTYQSMLTLIKKTENQYTSLANRITKSSESSEQLTASFNSAKSTASELAQILANVTKSGTIDKTQIARVKELSAGYFTAKENVGLFTAEAKKTRQELEAQEKQMTSMTTKTNTLKGQMDALASSMTIATTKGLSSGTLTSQMAQVQTYTENLENAFERYKAGSLTTEQYTMVVNYLTIALKKLGLAFKEEKAFVEGANSLISSQTKEVNSLTGKYQTLSDKIKSSPSLSKNGTLVTGVSQAIDTLQGFNAQLATGSSLTTEQRTQLESLTKQLVTFNTQSKSGTSIFSNFITTLTDKARWLLAFYLITKIREAFTALLDTIKETETTVVELQRVLNEDVSSGIITYELYQLAIDYGRTIDEVSESAVKFAQAGYEWADVLELVESTLLAVNTAELEVDDATTNLIAVMSQFNLEATEMGNIIDEINITSDNFAVTSEKITDALVRAGGTASAYGLELEETIALITSLSEATGRSGSNLGTALNSLITFSSKASSLDIFAQMGGDVEEAVKAYEMGASSIIDVWTAVSASIDSLTSQQASVLDELLSSDDYSEFASELESEASDLTDTIQATYSTVGTYRQNYFIGLLGNLETYEAALDGMVVAEGYSLEENEKVMDTLEARSQALSSSFKKLAADYGEDGGLDLLKTLTSWVQGAVDVVDALGGIPSILGVILTSILYIKAQSVGTALTKLASIIPSIVIGLKNFALHTKEVAVSMVTLKASMGDVLLVVTLLYTAYQLVTGVSEKLRAEILSGVSDSLEATNAYKEQAKSLSELTQSYKDAYEYIDGEWVATSKLNDVVETITDSYWLAKEARDALNSSYEEGIDVLHDLTDAQYEAWKTENLADYKKALDVISKSQATEFGYNIIQQTYENDYLYSEDFLNQLKEIGVEVKKEAYSINQSTGELTNEFFFSFETENAIEQINLLRGAMDLLYQSARDSGGWTSDSEELFSVFSNEVDRLKSEYSKFLDLIEEFEVTEAGHVFEEMKPAIEDIIDAGGDLDVVLGSIGAEFGEMYLEGEGTRDAILGLAEAFYYATTSAKETATALTSVSDATKAYTELIDDNYDKMKSVVDAQNELTESGYLSVSTVQDLYETFEDLDGILELTENGFVTTADALDSLIDKQIEQANLELNEAKQAAVSFINAQGDKTVSINTETEALKENIRTKALAVAADMAMNRTVTRVEGDSAAGISYSDYEEYKRLSSLYKELMEYYNDIVVAEQDVVDITNLYNQVVRESTSATSDSSDATDGLTEAQQAYIDELENSISTKEKLLQLNENESYEDQIGLIQEIKSELHTLADYYRSLDYDELADEILDLRIAYEGWMDEIDSLTESELSDWQDTINAQIEENIELLEAQKDTVNEYYDDLIEKLEEVEEENDRLIAQQEYYDSLDDAKSSLAEASARSGVEYREEEADIMGEINDLQDDWQQQLDDWELEDQISALERARDNKIKALEELIEIIENASDLVIDVDLSTSSSAEDILQELEDKYGVPLSEYTVTLADEMEKLQLDAIENVASEAPSIYNEKMLVPIAEDFNKLFVEDMSVMAIDSAEIFLTAWQDGFINPVREDLNNILSDFSNQASLAIETLAVAQATAMDYVAQATAAAVTTTNSYNTTTSNSVVNLAPSSYSNYSSLISSISTLP